jgi:hypothetical protein
MDKTEHRWTRRGHSNGVVGQARSKDEQYVTKRRRTLDIASEIAASPNTISRLLHERGIPVRPAHADSPNSGLTARDGFPEPLANVRTAAPKTCRARRARAVDVAPVRRLLPRRPCARALAARPSALRPRWLRSPMISAAQGSRQSKRSMPNRRSRAARRPSLEQLLLPPNRRYRVRPSRTDRPRRPRTLSRIETKREGLSTYPRPRPLVERTDCSFIPRPSVHLLSIPTTDRRQRG